MLPTCSAREGEAVVVDPQRDVEIYLKAAEEHGSTIRHIFETHLHADFVSGHKELAARTGAKIYIGNAGRCEFPHVAVHDGFELQSARLRSACWKRRATRRRAFAWLSRTKKNLRSRGPF